MEAETTQTFSWKSAINETFHDFYGNFVNYVPQILGALLLLIIGYGIAHLARIFTKKAIRAFDSLFCKFVKPVGSSGAHITAPFILGMSRIVFWCIMLFFFAASSNLLGWELFTGWMDGIVNYLPSVLTGLLIIFVGFLASNAVLAFILNSDLKTNAPQSSLLARLAQIVILVSSIIIGVEHIGLDMHFLTDMVIIVIAVLLAGACLAFGLGAREMVANTIGSQYIRRNCRVGERIKLAGFEGELLEIRQTCIVLDHPEEGRIIIPSKLFNEQISIIRAAEVSSSATDNQEDEVKGSQ